MEKTEKIESINTQLIDLYGIDTVSGQAMWRVVWSEDQFEHRLGTYDDFTESNIFLRTVTEVRYVPKYRQWIKERYVLERLVLIPEVSMPELPAAKMSYEPMFPFEDDRGRYLPPTLPACQFIIDAVYQQIGKTAARYKDPLSGLSSKDQLEKKNMEINELQMDLFGNESATGDALAHGEDIVVHRNYEKEH